MTAPARRTSRLSWLLGTAALIGVLPWSHPALAQDGTTAQATDGALAIPEVEVQATAWRAWQPVQGYVAPVTTTGTKTDTPLIEAPQSVGVVTRQQMDDQAPQTVSEALRYTAGVLPEVRPSARYDSVFVRGFGGQGTSAAFVNFLDGLRVGRGANYAVPNFDPWLLERIEVLRGPASVLYGQTGAGGLVNLVSRRPTETPIHEVRLEAGNDARMQTAFDFGGPLTADGTFQYRLTGIGRIADTQVDYVGEKRIAIAPALTWRPSSDTTVTVLAGFQDDPEIGFYNFYPATGTVLPNRNGSLGRNFFAGDPNWQKDQRRQAWVGYQLEHRLDDTWTVRQNLRYMNIDSERRVLSIASIAADGRTATRRALHAIEHADTLALDNQAQATFSTGPLRHTLLGGVDWSATWADSRVAVGTAPSLDLFAPVYYRTITGPAMGNAARTSQETDQVGVYLQDQIALDRFRLNLGIRHDWANSDTQAYSTGLHTKQDDQEWTWRVGGLYLFDSGVAPYVSYSTSFLPNAGVQAPARGGKPFEATTGEQYEVGVKYQPPGRTSFVQLAAYQITQDNVLTPDPLYTTFSVSTGRIRSRGIELDARASLTNNLDLIGAYAYTEAEIRRSNTAGVAGNRVPQVPEHSASGWLNYRFTEGALRGLQLGGGARYVGETYGNEANSFKVKDFTLFDAAVRYDFGARFESMKGLEFAVNASNLADKEYVASCNTDTTCYFGTGRLVLGSLRMRW
ncbi:TonB-dependent siderophore receptor [Roseomonas sp. OT10]|uniref:TonB-dependent siderophore receptor n=1 Tax=Roseomonas cutis TaxID=2897332 RepID=UPI001E404B9E|nr:TonB-dependent siderophore receptor [Roseomonas sp. OT10]UFN50055.1 TonB-dependent siderophore receptor [Roseomonas sp. OT10]